MLTPTIRRIIALVISVILVHLLYAGYIWPQADLDLLIAQSQGQSTVRSIPVILKDLEQEICIILMLWGFYLMGEKAIGIARYRYLFDIDLLQFPDDNTKDSPETILVKMREGLEGLDQLSGPVKNTPLVKTVTAVVRRYVTTRSVQNTSDAIVTEVEAVGNSLESENSMIRYLIWAIPSIGFIGTVRGIGEALTHADQALSGNIVDMASSLGVAFNSTLVALVISIIMMLFLHQLQRLQDDLVGGIQTYCGQYVIERIGKANAGN